MLGLHAAGFLGAALLLFALALCLGLCPLLVHDSLLRRPLSRKYAGPVRLWRWRRWCSPSSFSSSHDLVLLFLFVVVAVKARSLRLRRLRSLNSRHLAQASAALAGAEPRELPFSGRPSRLKRAADSFLWRPFQPGLGSSPVLEPRACLASVPKNFDGHFLAADQVCDWLLP